MNMNSSAADADHGGGTHISALPPDVLQSHIFGALDGRSIASVSFVSRGWRSICSDDTLWEQICRSDFPSVAAVSTSQSRRSLYSDSATISCPDLKTRRSPEELRHSGANSSKLISSVDVFCDGKPLCSRQFTTETTSGEFLTSPFKLDLLNPDETASVATPLTFEDEEECMEQAKERLRVSWILIDPIKKRAFNVCGRRPVEAERSWFNGFVRLRFSTVVVAAGPCAGGELAQFSVAVTCGGKPGGEMEVVEATMQADDFHGKAVSGTEALQMVEEAMQGPRRVSDWSVERERYRLLHKKKRMHQIRETEVVVEKTNLDSAATVFLAGVCILMLAFAIFATWRT